MAQKANIYVFANQKVGVTKSTSSANLAAALSRKGKKVLFIKCTRGSSSRPAEPSQPYRSSFFSPAPRAGESPGRPGALAKPQKDS